MRILAILNLNKFEEESAQNSHIFFELSYFALKTIKKMIQFDTNYMESLKKKDYKFFLNFLENVLEFLKKYITNQSQKRSPKKKNLKEEEFSNDESVEIKQFEYLKLYYQVSEYFVYLIQNNQFLNFKKIKIHVLNICKFLYDILTLINENKLEFLTFYVYVVSRILVSLQLKKEKNYDTYEYEDLFKNIFDQKQIKGRLKEWYFIFYLV